MMKHHFVQVQVVPTWALQQNKKEHLQENQTCGYWVLSSAFGETGFVILTDHATSQ